MKSTGGLSPLATILPESLNPDFNQPFLVLHDLRLLHNIPQYSPSSPAPFKSQLFYQKVNSIILTIKLQEKRKAKKSENGDQWLSALKNLTKKDVKSDCHSVLQAGNRIV